MRNFFSNALILVTALAFLPHPLLVAGTEIVQMNRSVIPRFTLEQAIDYIQDDELIEVTPDSIRMRKKFLSENDRKRR